MLYPTSFSCFLTAYPCESVFLKLPNKPSTPYKISRHGDISGVRHHTLVCDDAPGRLTPNKIPYFAWLTLFRTKELQTHTLSRAYLVYLSAPLGVGRI